MRAHALLVVAALSACGDVDEARAQWLRQTLVLDNQVFFDRVPSLTAGKLALMSESPYAFFRGTAAQYARDTMLAGGAGYTSTAYMTADTRDVAIVGDPHPENIGTYRTRAGALTVDFNDFDAATYGPYVFDVRRLALGFWMAGREAERSAAPDAAAVITEAVRHAAVDAASRAYAEEVARIAADPRAGLVLVGEGPWGAVALRLLAEAEGDGEARTHLGDYTDLDGAERTMHYGDLTPARVLKRGGYSQLIVEDSVRGVSAREEAMVVAVVDACVAAMVDPTLLAGERSRVLGVSRRFGAGVSSYPVLRYYALLAGATADPDDDVLVEIKETVDPVALPGLQRFPEPGFGSNAERVVQMQRRLQAFDDNDPFLGAMSTGGQSFRMRERTAYQQGFRVSTLVRRLDEGDWAPEEFVVFAAIAGRLLARSHGRARKQSGQRAASAIATAIGGDIDGFAEETTDFAQSYGPTVERDHALLQGLLSRFGFDLGYAAR